MRKVTLLLIIICSLSACKKDTTHEVSVVLYGDAVHRHILNQPYVDAGAYGLDYMNKHLEATVDISNVNVNQTGSYKVKISATDEYGNVGTTERTVVVFNELEYLEGNWSCYKYPQGSGTADTIYIETLHASPTENRLFTFTRFSNYDNAPIQGHINANLITIDSLQYFIGPTQSLNIRIYGDGLQMNSNRLEIEYGEIINNNTLFYTATIARE
jgi:hypothetical protein